MIEIKKLSVDVELSVKNGAELLDRLIKDIVTEKSSFYNTDLEQNTAIQIASDGSVEETGRHGNNHPLIQEQGTVPGTTKIHGEPTTFNLPSFSKNATETVVEKEITLH
jgi:hypothetical protein